MSSFTMAEPMNPVAPVTNTRIRFSFLISFELGLTKGRRHN
jgi:hypothetical protein